VFEARDYPLPQSLVQLDSLRAAGRAPEALRALDSLLVIARANASADFERQVLHVRGRHRFGMGLLNQASADLEQAMRLADESGDSLAAGWSLRWLAISLAQGGRLQESIAAYTELQGRARRLNSPILENMGSWGLAWASQMRGDFDAARRQFQEVVDTFRDLGDQRAEAYALLGLGHLQHMLGDARAAHRSGLRLLSLSRDAGIRETEASALHNLSVLEYEFGDPGLAIRFVREAMDLSRAAQDPRAAAYGANLLALALHSMRRDQEAAAILDSLIGEARSKGDQDLLLYAMYTLAQVRQSEGRASEALKLHREILSTANSTEPNVWVPSLIALARAAGGPAASLQFMRENVSRLEKRIPSRTRELIDLEEARFLIASQDYDSAIELLHRTNADSSIAVNVELARCFRALGDDDSALVSLERAEHLWEILRGRPSDPEWREVLGADSRAFVGDLLELLIDLGRTPEAFEAAQRFKARTFVERMGGPSFQRSDSANAIVAPTVPLSSFQRDVLRSRELYLDAVVGERAGFLFAVTSDSLRVTRLPDRQNLEAKVRLYHEVVASHPIAREDREIDGGLERLAARALSDTLLGPFGDLIGRSRIIIYSPDGPLHGLGLSELPVPHSAETEYRPIADDREITRVPSVTVLATLRGRPSTPDDDASLRILALGAPGGEADELFGVRSEVRFLNGEYAGVTLRETDADSVSLDEAIDLSGYDLLHLAGHFHLDNERPWNSALLLRADADPTRESRLTATDVLDTKLRARLCFLSGCESARGKTLPGEGVQGMAGAFLAAGVGSVVATLWPVDDRVTRELVQEFYRGIERGETAGAALARAQRSIRAASATSAPFYWAGFVLVGEPETRIPLTRRQWPHRLVALSGGALLIVSGILGLVWRRGTRGQLGDTR
jgi:CHAT domain-containing protein/tetratricopeptide (TPR) repeat protein